MKLKKILTAIAATAVMTSLFAIGASAAGEITGVSYNATSGKVSFTLPEYTADQKTLLIIKTGADGSYNLGTLADTDIMQIDQNSTFGENGTPYTVQLDATKLTSKDKIRVFMGGGDKLYVSDPAPCGSVQVFIGDADGNGKITAQDASEIAKKTVGKTSAIDKAEINWYAAAYSDGNGKITAQDASEIAKKTVGKTVKYVGQNVDKGLYGEKPAEATE